jgi:hypothetical protein
LTVIKVWGGGGEGGVVDTMDWQCASYLLLCCYLKAYKIFFLFDMTLFSAYILYKIISQKLKYNQFRLVIAEELLDGLITPEYARRGHPAAYAL